MRRPTLQQVFALTIVGLAALLGLLFVRINESTRDALMESSSRIRAEKTKAIGDRVLSDLAIGRRATGHVEELLREGAVRIENVQGVEAVLFAQVVEERALSEATLTHAVLLGEEGEEPRLAPGDRWQMSVFRARDGGRIVTRYDHLENGRFVRDARERPAGGDFAGVPLARTSAAEVGDPTRHLTFRAAVLTFLDAVRTGSRNEMVASDLHWSPLDDDLPEQERRAVVTGQKAIAAENGRFLGVLRVGMFTANLDRLVPQPTPADPHRVFFCDAEGRLLTGIGPRDAARELDDGSLRVVPADPPGEVVAALADPVLRAISPQRPEGAAGFTVGGARYLATYRYIRGSQDWIVGIVAPESYYLGGLAEQRRHLLLMSLGIMAVILSAGWLTLRAVRRGLAVIEGTTARMRDFDFAPSEVRLPFRDFQDVGERLEVAKTAMRAMGRYVPVDLVRLLYRTGREPRLGGEILEVSMVFTDIEGFTTLSERLEPNELAWALGRYFEAMTAAIHAHEGIIDKYIGDGIMALWNAPRPCADHARRACEAALACLRAADELFTSPEWKGLPRLRTRVGIHRDRVMVGHFGAPDRMSYTALGDGVNLAARLEGLNKQYGTTILASEEAWREAGPHFAGRLLDRVAVKGKTRGIEVHELLGPAGHPVPGSVNEYERALRAYWAQDFAGAAAILDPPGEDPPSRVLLERCRRFAAAPPPADWDGIWIATSK